MGVWARQEASREEAAVIHTQGIRRERRGRGFSWMGHLGLAPGSHFVLRNSLTSDSAVLGAAMKVSL